VCVNFFDSGNNVHCVTVYSVYCVKKTVIYFMNAFIDVPSSQLLAMSTVFADHRHEACFLDTCLLCVTGPSHMHTCHRTPGSTCVVLQHRDLGHGGSGSVHTMSDDVKTRWLDYGVSHK